MTKQQVKHLELRLSVALKDKLNSIKFDEPQPTGTKEQQINADILEKTGIDLLTINSYHAHNVLRDVSIYLLQNSEEFKGYKDRLDTFNKGKEEFTLKKQKEINEILDAAILGDSTEALEALKKFQENL